MSKTKEDVSKEVESFFRALFNESERGTVIVLTDRLDDLLQNLHAAFIKHVSDATDNWIKNKLEHNASLLGSFGSRIDVGYGYGLIDKPMYEDLEIIRKVRAEAAHTFAAFDCASHSDRIFNLHPPKRQGPGVGLTQDEIDVAANPRRATARTYLIIAGMALGAEIMNRTTAIKSAYADQLSKKLSEYDSLAKSKKH